MDTNTRRLEWRNQVTFLLNGKYFPTPCVMSHVCRLMLRIVLLLSFTPEHDGRIFKLRNVIIINPSNHQPHWSYTILQEQATHGCPHTSNLSKHMQMHMRGTYVKCMQKGCQSRQHVIGSALKHLQPISPL